MTTDPKRSSRVVSICRNTGIRPGVPAAGGIDFLLARTCGRRACGGSSLSLCRHYFGSFDLKSNTEEVVLDLAAIQILLTGVLIETFSDASLYIGT